MENNIDQNTNAVEDALSCATISEVDVLEGMGQEEADGDAAATEANGHTPGEVKGGTEEEDCDTIEEAQKGNTAVDDVHDEGEPEAIKKLAVELNKKLLQIITRAGRIARMPRVVLPDGPLFFQNTLSGYGAHIIWDDEENTAVDDVQATGDKEAIKKIADELTEKLMNIITSAGRMEGMPRLDFLDQPYLIQNTLSGYGAQIHLGDYENTAAYASGGTGAIGQEEDDVDKEDIIQNTTPVNRHALGEELKATDEEEAEKNKQPQEKDTAVDDAYEGETEAVAKGEVDVDKEEIIQKTTSANGYAHEQEKKTAEEEGAEETHEENTAVGDVYAAGETEATEEGKAAEENEPLMQNITRAERIARMPRLVFPDGPLFYQENLSCSVAHINWDDGANF